MITSDTIREVSEIFCGDISGYYTYKSGPKLVEFFNSYFQYKDIYQSGFPSRWAYVHDKIIDLINNKRFDRFLSIVLSKSYIISELKCSEVDAAEKQNEILGRFNMIFNVNQYSVVGKDGKFSLVKTDDDLVQIGYGGFANVYKQKSTGLILKKLKDDFLSDKGIRSRFKREFNITKSLQDLTQIVRVYSYDDNTCSYTMEEAEQTLKDYINNYDFNDTTKITCIRQILNIMKEVHRRDIIHRDLSPTNIFIMSGVIKIADFGLGKDLNVLTSHQTMHTNAVGQYSYCAPEQFMLLKDGDKQSDVYSLGRIINFIMTKDPYNSHHMFRSVAEKSTNHNAVYRYSDAEQLLQNFEKLVLYHSQSENEATVLNKIHSNVLDDNVESYIYEMSSEKISQQILKNEPNFVQVLIKFMKLSSEHAEFIIQSVETSYDELCRTFDSYDAFSDFATLVLKNGFSYTVNELAAIMLHHIAFDVNRFHAQHQVESIIDTGVEPMIEEILKG